MSTSHIWSLGNEVLTQNLRNINAAASGISPQMKSGSSSILCYTIRAPHDETYWKLFLQALDVTISSRNLSDQVIQGVFLSFMIATKNVPCCCSKVF